MATDITRKYEGNAKTPVEKRSYAAPKLTVFGRVLHLTQGTQVVGNDTGFAAGKNPGGSDRSIKDNISRIGTHPMGFGLYLFDYKPEYVDTWGTGRQFGVMADEVETVMPGAVSVHADGYKLVNYAMLGIA